jgi:hypothetical protein
MRHRHLAVLVVAATMLPPTRRRSGPGSSESTNTPFISETDEPAIFLNEEIMGEWRA